MKYLIGVVLMMVVVGCTDTTGPDVEQQPSTAVLTLDHRAARDHEPVLCPNQRGTEYSCGRTMTGGKLYCWGYNAYGQLGNASLNNKKRPTPVSSTLQFRWVSAGPSHTCAIATDAKAYCWGANWRASSGTAPPQTAGRRRWSLGASPGSRSRWEATAAHTGFTCGLTTGGRIYCWGDNYYGQLGNGTAGSDAILRYPRKPPTSGSLTGSSPQEEATAARSVRQTWRTAGATAYGQTGNGGTFYQPTVVSGGLAFRQVTAGVFTPAVPPPATRPTAGDTVPMARLGTEPRPIALLPGPYPEPSATAGYLRVTSHLRPDDRAESLLLGHELQRPTWQWDHNRSARPRRGAD